MKLSGSSRIGETPFCVRYSITYSVEEIEIEKKEKKIYIYTHAIGQEWLGLWSKVYDPVPFFPEITKKEKSNLKCPYTRLNGAIISPK